MKKKGKEGTVWRGLNREKGSVILIEFIQGKKVHGRKLGEGSRGRDLSAKSEVRLIMARHGWEVGRPSRRGDIAKTERGELPTKR